MKNEVGNKRSPVPSKKNDNLKQLKPSKENKSIKKVIKNSTIKSANSTAPKKTTSKTSSKSSKAKVKSKIESNLVAKTMLTEYYDLPYKYNQTMVKILAQTPTTLFVYWDISDEDRNSLINMHGENFFNETRPVLIVHNITKNYSYEIDINDFANSWYIRTQEPNCDYSIELGRRFNKQNGEYIYINSSNGIISPNDHILFENANLGDVLFRNVKTNTTYSKNFGDLRFINDIDKLYGNIYDVYNTLYDNELLSELSNPSSSEFYSDHT